MNNQSSLQMRLHNGQTTEAISLGSGPSRTKPALLEPNTARMFRPQMQRGFKLYTLPRKLKQFKWISLALVTTALTRPNLRNSNSKFGLYTVGDYPSSYPCSDSAQRSSIQSGYSDPKPTLRLRTAGYLLPCCFTSKKSVPSCVSCSMFAGPSRFDPSERQDNTK